MPNITGNVATIVTTTATANNLIFYQYLLKNLSRLSD